MRVTCLHAVFDTYMYQLNINHRFLLTFSKPSPFLNNKRSKKHKKIDNIFDACKIILAMKTNQINKVFPKQIRPH